MQRSYIFTLYSLLFTLYLYLYLYLYSLSLSKKFDRDNERLNSILQHIFYTVQMSNFLARWQDEKKQHIIRNKEFRQ
jgi:hypothetical protein